MKKLLLLLFLTLSLIEVNAQMSCNFTYTTSGNTANFTHSWPMIGTMTIDSLHFSYGDGTNAVISPYTPTSSHTYANPGFYFTCMVAFMSNINQPGVISCTYCDSVVIGGTSSCSVSVNANASGSTVNAVANAIGGVAPYIYSYTLNPGNITNNTGIFPGLATGAYNVCVTAIDAMQNTCSIGCDSVIVGNNSFCNTSVNVTGSGTTVTASASATFGTPPYTYSYTLNPGNITNSTGTFLGLAPGLYTVCATATDANNQSCTPDCDSVFLGGSFFCSTAMNLSASGNTVTAVGSASFGTAPYTYSYTLNPGNITNNTGVFSGLANGLYTVCATATDANNQTCTPVCDSIFVGNTTSCTTLITTSVSGNTVTAVGNASGGVAPYTYSYTLNPGNITNNTGVFPGLANGNYIVCVVAYDAMQNFCSSSCDSVSVGGSTFCNTAVSLSASGNTVTATGSASFGTAPYTYSYTLTPGNITNNTGVFSGLANGSYIVCATATDANNLTCTPACDSIYLFNTTTCVTTISTSVSGNTITAVGNASGGTAPYTYSYTLNPGSITNNTGVFSGLANGLYSVCVTAFDAMQNVCSIACDSAFVGNSTGCVTTISTSVSGNTITAVGNASGGTAPYSYSYTLNPGNLTNSTGIFSGLPSGFYAICVTATDAMQNVCSIACDSAAVFNNNGNCIVNPSFSESISGLTINFTNSSTITNGIITNYAWSFGDGNVSSTASPTHTYSSSGVYNVVLVVTGFDTLQNQCIDSVTKVLTVSNGGTSVNNVNAQRINIYPNPTTKNFIVDLPEGEKLQGIVLTDVSGRKVSTEYQFVKNNKISVRFKNEAVGIYFIKLQTDKNLYTSSIMKQE